jgi:hypothetical protein
MIETERYSKGEVAELRERVWRAVAGPVHASIGETAVDEPEAQAGANV